MIDAQQAVLASELAILDVNLGEGLPSASGDRQKWSGGARQKWSGATISIPDEDRWRDLRAESWSVTGA
jgi:hypothetical protein